MEIPDTSKTERRQKFNRENQEKTGEEIALGITASLGAVSMCTHYTTPTQQQSAQSTGQADLAASPKLHTPVNTTEATQHKGLHTTPDQTWM